MSSFIKSRTFLLSIAIIIQLFIYIPYFFDVPVELKNIETGILQINPIITNFAMFIGVYTASRREILRVVKKGKAWGYSIWVLFTMWAMIVSGLALGTGSDVYRFFMNGILTPGDATIYSIVLFYMISAGARAFKLRDKDSAVLVIATVLVLFRQAPIGAVIWPGFEPIGKWLTDNWGMAVSRVFTLVTAVASIVLAVRFLTGREMGMVGMTKEEK